MSVPWTSLTQLVEKAHSKMQRIDFKGEMRQDAGLLATTAFDGIDQVARVPELVNIAALALSMSDRLVRHRASDGAIRLVHGTNLHSLPSEPPKLLRGPWIVEARNPDRAPLFGHTAELAGYPVDGDIFLVGLERPDGARVAKWTPQWGGQDLKESITPDGSPLIGDLEGHTEWTREAARFALVLAILMEAEGAPVTPKDEKTKRKKGKIAATGIEGGWLTRRLYIDDRRRAAPPADHRWDGSGEGVPEGRIAHQAFVEGHLKRQAYGPGRSLRKWIYVRSYEARRWIAPRPLSVDIRTHSE